MTHPPFKTKPGKPMPANAENARELRKYYLAAQARLGDEIPRHKICSATGISAAMLNYMLHGHRTISPENYEEIMCALDDAVAQGGDK